ncbi:hypothetical protein KNJ79_05025 [Sphingopyxis indica]|uniref:hypothetical protein n=1 Tax=Sphingopyxis indica TaxID=436663 RepID=UPI002939165A|nr:hypothetical protein [Sphingopyxis indica]WOF44294.1 hypothetical protein KNJ79_05025 [Sphingopyxis indica]
MSRVTGVCLFTEPAEDPRLIKAVTDWLAERNFGPLKDVADHGGGTKHPQWREYSAGYNYFVDAAEFAEFVLALDWDWPENVILMTQREDEHMSVWRRT